MNDLYVKLFEMWMKEYHPYHFIVTGVIYILFTLLGIASIVFVWFFDWWWKMAITVAIFFAITRAVHRFYLRKKMEEFKYNKDKKVSF